MRWKEFQTACPEIAELARERFTRDQLVMLGTLRADGSPRITPCEVDVADGELVMGMMWHSRKALDLLRDPRIVVHSVTVNKEGTDGDLKLSGRAHEVRDERLFEAARDATETRTDWRPPERTHFFRLEIERAGYVIFGDGGYGLAWTPSTGLHRLPLPTAE